MKKFFIISLLVVGSSAFGVDGEWNQDSTQLKKHLKEYFDFKKEDKISYNFNTSKEIKNLIELREAINKEISQFSHAKSENKLEVKYADEKKKMDTILKVTGQAYNNQEWAEEHKYQALGLKAAKYAAMPVVFAIAFFVGRFSKDY